MENEKYQDDFEQFLQDEVKQHRMFPSDHIWNSIRTELHGYKAWPALTFISLFIITALTVSTLISNHPHDQPVLKIVSPQTEEAAQPVSAVAVVAHNKHKRNYFEQKTDGQISEETFANATDIAPAAEGPLAINKLRDISIQAIPAQQNKVPVAGKAASQVIISALSENIARYAVQPVHQTIEQAPVENQTAADNAATVSNTDPAEQTIVPDEYRQSSARTVGESLKNYAAQSIINTRRGSRFGFQFYITPSNSYRKLSDQKVKEVVQPAVNAITPLANTPPNTAITDVNTVVRHRPAVGIELGFAFLYNIAPRLKFKTGVQLNVRQYYIETFQSLTNEQASLSLIKYGGVETISLYSPYNNNTGYKQTQLENRVYQVSVPLGFQWDIIQGRGIGLNAEASVQPTMTLNNDTYLLSTDYKHYTNGNDFLRKWNINTSVGLNFSYKVGSTSWQIGPQVRYQHLPTYSNAYPIRENLMDYGVRIGFTKQLNK